MNPGFGYWFSGIFDGEGSLQAWKSSENRTHSGVTLSLRFDDLHLLKWIQEETGVGSVKNKTVASGQHPQFVWRVTNVPDLVHSIIPVFDEFPLHSKKAKEYVFWKQFIMNSYTVFGGKPNGRRTFLLKDREQFEQEQERLISEINKVRYPIKVSS